MVGDFGVVFHTPSQQELRIIDRDLESAQGIHL